MERMPCRQSRDASLARTAPTTNPNNSAQNSIIRYFCPFISNRIRGRARVQSDMPLAVLDGGGLKQPSEASWDANNNYAYVQRGEGTKLFFDHAHSQPTLGSRLLGKSPRTALATNLAATAMMRWSRDHCDPKTRD